MLVLQTLVFGARHGHGIATTIQRTSKELLLVDHGSLYSQPLRPSLDSPAARAQCASRSSFASAVPRHAGGAGLHAFLRHCPRAVVCTLESVRHAERDGGRRLNWIELNEH
jgi:hypothetical protein